MTTTTTTTTTLGLALPPGYSLQAPADAQALLGETIPGQGLYGGADISRATDANGVLHIGCCARGPDSDFRFRVFRYLGPVASEVPLQARATGRGELTIDLHSGRMYWIAWEHSTFYTEIVPGAAPFAAWEPVTFAGGYIPCLPNLYNLGLDGQLVSGGRSLGMAQLFDVPPACRAYVVRLVCMADRADVRARLGTEMQPGQLTANTQVANVQIHQVGVVNAGAGGRIWLSVAPDGASAKVWLQVAGYWL